MLHNADGKLSVSVSDTGQGPAPDKPQAGMGSRIVRALANQLGAGIDTRRGPDGYTVELTIPLPAKH